MPRIIGVVRTRRIRSSETLYAASRSIEWLA